MKNGDCFHFKQFDVCHSNCAMKVGTDGVLLGVLAYIPASNDNELTVLDIGTGSGLISLMLAQRCENAHIVGLDIDGYAVQQAHENFLASPWHNRLTALQGDVRTWNDGKFRLIISNPPFYSSAPTMNDEARRMARVNETLSFKELIQAAVRLLTNDGIFQVIIPFDEVEHFRITAWQEGLFLWKQTNVKTKEIKPYKRAVLTFGRESKETVYETLCLMDSEGNRSAEYAKLTEGFYVK